MALIYNERINGIPQVGPRLEIWCGKVRSSRAQHFGEEFATLELRRLSSSDPICKGHATLLGPMAEERRLADAAAAIEHNQLAWPWVRSREHLLEKRELCSTIKKHSSLKNKHQP